MNIKRYIKDKVYMIIIAIIFVLLVGITLRAYGIDSEVIIVSTVLYAVSFFIIMSIEFIKKAKFYNRFLENVENLDKKYLIGNMIEEPSFLEGEIVVGALYEISKSMTDYINEYKGKLNDFKEYIEMWIHEVKLPIAAMSLRLHNGDNCDRVLLSQTKRVEEYVEQVLYLTRSEYADKDYLIKNVNIMKVVRNVALKNKDVFLESNVGLEVGNMNLDIYTDEKWLEFILNQIVGNSIKYRKNEGNAKVRIYCEQKNNSTVIHIWDNGVGIRKTDIGRVFDKTFTGSNGHISNKSTGIGLYIAKKLCNKLGHNITIESQENEYTKVSIEVANNDFYKVVQ